MSDFKSEVTKERNLLIVNFLGEINPGNEEFFFRELEKIQNSAAEEGNNVILDFCGLEYINSTGLGAIAHFYRQCTQKNLRVIICNLSAMCSRLFEITKLDQIFEITDSLDEARAVFEP